MTTAESTGNVQERLQTAKAYPTALVILAYVTMVLAAPVYGFWRAFIPVEPSRLLWLQAGVLLALWLLTFIWRTIRGLRGFLLVVLVANILGGWFMPVVSSSPFWGGLFGESSSYFSSHLGSLLLKVATSLIMIGLLLLMGLRRRDFFLVKGQLDAPTERTRLLPGMKENETWLTSGRNVAIGVFVAGLILLIGLNLPRLGMDSLVRALPLLPFALLFAAMNAFHEEVNFRAAPLSQLDPVLGRHHALLITTIVFGLGHFAGSIPDKVVGVAIACFLGFIMGKAMLETRGIAWPWFLHFAADVPIFILLAMNAVG
jgi:membrane protease YdiL (CAAX protease family)